MTKTILTLSFIASFTLLGCGGGADGEKTDVAAKAGSCREGGDKGSTCSDYTAEGAKDGKNFCDKTGGGSNIWSDDKCPAENMIGTCERNDGQSQRYYSTGEDAMDADTAKEMCVEMSNGKWVAGGVAAPAEPAAEAPAEPAAEAPAAPAAEAPAAPAAEAG